MNSVIQPAKVVLSIVHEALKAGQRVRFTATGNSMQPFLRHNDTVELSAIGGDPRIGDILLARIDEDTFVLHRLYKIDKDGFCLIGDSTVLQEGPLSRESILGKVVSVDRGKHRRVMDRGLWYLLGFCWLKLLPLRKPLLRSMRFFASIIRTFVSRLRADSRGSNG